MNWVDALTLAARSLRRRPGRALLTILAVTLGATLLVALASVAPSARSRLVSKLTHGGPPPVIPVIASRILAMPPPFGSAATPTSGISAFGDTMVGVDLTQVRNLPITILAGR